MVIKTGARAATPKPETPPVVVSKKLTEPKPAKVTARLKPKPEPAVTKREPVQMKPGIYLDMTNADYHAHKDVISSTMAKTIVQDGGPALLRHNLDKGQEHKKVFDMGTVFHSYTLESTFGAVVELDYENYRTKAAQEERDEVISAGNIPMLAHELTVIKEMRESVMADYEARQIIESAAQIEASVFGELNGVPARCRPDIWGNGFLADLKSDKDASREGFLKSVENYGYYQQDPFYADIVESVTGEKHAFKFIVCESSAPCRVAVYSITEYFRGLGRGMNRRATDLWQQCHESGIWPGHQRREPLDPRPFTEAKILETVEG